MQSWGGSLTGMMHEIAGDQRLCALGLDAHADMARGVADCRNEADFVANPVIGLDQVGEPGRVDRRN